MGDISVVDIRILIEFLRVRGTGLHLVVGPRTAADGSCFLHAMRQSMIHLKKKGKWSGPIPEDVEDLRAQVVQFMSTHRALWTRPSFNQETGLYQDAPLTDDIFNNLLKQQAEPRTWTDTDGYFVQGTCMYLHVELHVILPSIPGEIMESGLGGPYQIINKSDHAPEEQSVFFVGLIQDQRNNGHYQFLFKAENQEPEQFPALIRGK